ncbi:hypothetical protein ACFWXO_30865 [Kitasatospora sp. NPDC059088]|uniref:hypothetical protein n=1 Tax=Kitasatospora sp. NPDC059088 TaxID=3346722 RepID=UPI0036B71ABE
MPAFPADRVEDLVSLLGPPWHIAADPYEGHQDYRRFVADGRGRGFFLSFSSRNPGGGPALRIVARGRYPAIPGYFEDDARPAIGFSLGRPLEDLARDMRRRFLPAYDAAFGRAVDAIHARAVASGGREGLARELLARFPHPDGHFRDDPREGLAVHFRLAPDGAVSAKAETRGTMEQVRLTLDHLTLRQLRRVLDALSVDDGRGTTTPRCGM